MAYQKMFSSDKGVPATPNPFGDISKQMQNIETSLDVILSCLKLRESLDEEKEKQELQIPSRWRPTTETYKNETYVLDASEFFELIKLVRDPVPNNARKTALVNQIEKRGFNRQAILAICNYAKLELDQKVEYNASYKFLHAALNDMDEEVDMSAELFQE